MRVVFMGTPHFAAVILEYLAQHHDVVGVFTRPDAIRSRGKETSASPVKEMARKYVLPVYEYASFKEDEPKSLLKELAPDVVCVAAYGALLPKEVLDVAPYGALNVHASLLPRWRGAAPIEHAILSGDEYAGVSIMKMEEGLDTGAYSVQRSLEIGSLTAEELTDELAVLGASALLVALQHIELGEISWVEQDETQVTYAHKIQKGALDINPCMSVRDNLLRIQATSTSHTSRATFAGKNVTILRAADVSVDDTQAPFDLPCGHLVFRAKRLFASCSDGIFELLSLRPDGKKDMDAKAFAAGVQGIKSGDITWEALGD